jgi:hypothetical protein
MYCPSCDHSQFPKGGSGVHFWAVRSNSRAFSASVVAAVASVRRPDRKMQAPGIRDRGELLGPQVPNVNLPLILVLSPVGNHQSVTIWRPARSCITVIPGNQLLGITTFRWNKVAVHTLAERIRHKSDPLGVWRPARQGHLHRWQSQAQKIAAIRLGSPKGPFRICHIGDRCAVRRETYTLGRYSRQEGTKFCFSAL